MTSAYLLKLAQARQGRLDRYTQHAGTYWLQTSLHPAFACREGALAQLHISQKMTVTGPPTLVGVAVAVGGNICISAALNIQKLAHKRLEASASSSGTKRSSRSRSRSRSRPRATETSPLLPHEDGVPSLRHSASSPPSPPPAKVAALALFSQTDPSARRTPPQRPLTQSKSTGTVPLLHAHAQIRGAVEGFRSVDGFGLTDAPGGAKAPTRRRSDGSSSNGKKKELYIKSPLWWVGIVLLVIGEMGNFVAYGFAPASVVAPLGTVALVANCAIAPLLIGEVFDKGDLVGIGLAIIGAIQVVMSANGSDGGDQPLSPSTLLHLIIQPPFAVYTCLNLGIIALLVALSRTRYGHRVVWVDVGLCALIGSWTVLSTKAVSSLLGVLFLDCFRYPITWAALVVLLCTAILQVALLQRCLQRYEAKVVVPFQFVLFTIASIIGSAVLFGDFKSTDASRFLSFVFGVCAVFAGVYLLTRHEGGRSRGSDSGDDTEADGDQTSGTDAQSNAVNRPESVAVPTPPRLTHRRSQPLPVSSPGYFLIASPQHRRRFGPPPLRHESSGEGTDSEGDDAALQRI